MTMFTVAQSRPIDASMTGRLLSWVSAALANHRSRKALSGLDPHMLDDIGVSARAADAEAKRPLWDVPTHWTH